jgi:hypothetical protein
MILATCWATRSSGCRSRAILQAVNPSAISQAYLSSSNYYLIFRSTNSEKFFPINAAIFAARIQASLLRPIMAGFRVCIMLERPFRSLLRISF